MPTSLARAVASFPDLIRRDAVLRLDLGCHCGTDLYVPNVERRHVTSIADNVSSGAPRSVVLIFLDVVVHPCDSPTLAD
jgi:hypothetical protein